jgi:outer membrane protein assembly factor BamB
MRYGLQRLWALDGRTGAQQWTKDFRAYPTLDPPAYGNGRVYVQTGDGQGSFLWGYDAADGTGRIQTPYVNSGSTWLAPVVIDGGVYAGSGEGGMSRFDAVSGQQSYFLQRAHHEHGWTPAVANGLVFSFGAAPRNQGNLTAVHASTGATAYQILDNRLPSAATPVVTSGNRVIAVRGESVVAVDLAARAVAWTRQGSFLYSVAASDGVVYLASGQNVQARRESDGEVLWNWNPPNGGSPHHMVVAKNVLLVASYNRTYAVDLATHRETWSYPAAGQLSVSKDGVLFIAGGDGKVTAIDLR